MRALLLLIFFFICQSPSNAKDKDILELLQKKIPDASFTEIDNGFHYKREFVIMLKQPLDHKDKSKGYFEQRIFLSHYDQKAPMLIVTEGYAARPNYYELANMMKSNQLIVEYRYFGKSKPKNYDYAYLNNDQAIEDLHRIKKLFKKIYCKSWMSTGISKGGTTCLIYKSKYPKDVKVAVPYVAPLANSQSDPRCDEHILSIGTEECRDKIESFQLHSLDHRDSILMMMKNLVKTQGLKFDYVGMEAAFEYAVLEFSFSFWQWGHDCDRIPEKPTATQAFNLMNEIIGFDFYSDAVIDYFKPAFYQFMTENGYYSFIHKPFLSKLKTLKTFDNKVFAPQEVNLDFNFEYLEKVRTYLKKKGKRILIIQGENDPWAACGYVPESDQDMVLMVKKNGDHTTRINSFDPEDQEKIRQQLSKWMKHDLELPKAQ